MKITPEDFCEQFAGVKVHPANLAIKGINCVAKYRGADALHQMRTDLGYVQSSVHVVDPEVDAGTVLAISPRVYPESPRETDDVLHDRLKLQEYRLFPDTLAMLGSGQLDTTQLPIQMDYSELPGSDKN